MPPDVHLTIKKQLNDILRRHRDFRTVLASADLSHVPIGDLSFASAAPPVHDNSFTKFEYMDNVSGSFVHVDCYNAEFRTFASLSVKSGMGVCRHAMGF